MFIWVCLITIYMVILLLQTASFRINLWAFTLAFYSFMYFWRGWLGREIFMRFEKKHLEYSFENEINWFIIELERWLMTKVHFYNEKLFSILRIILAFSFPDKLDFYFSPMWHTNLKTNSQSVELSQRDYCA